jgi:GntR family transcriptional regulator of arabinose operon
MPEGIKSSSPVPIYRQLYEIFRESILLQKIKPGSRISSITEIQKEYQVARETAKIVLNKLADDGLIVKKIGKGSFVADLGPTKKVWGVIVPFFSAYIENLLHFIRIKAEEQNRIIQHVVDYNNPYEEIRLVGNMINQRYEAVIVVPVSDETKTADFYRNIVSGGTVVTLLDHTMAGSYFTYVIQSYDLGVKRAVSYLLSKTIKNIAFIKNEVWAGTNMVQELMEESFKNFVEKEGSSRVAYVLDHISHLSREYMDKERIGGIFCCDDMDAIRVIGKLKKEGIDTPGDVSVVSYGNTELASYFTPRITSIDCHPEEMAEKTVEIINSNINGTDTRFSQYILQPDIIIRDT